MNADITYNTYVRCIEKDLDCITYWKEYWLIQKQKETYFIKNDNGEVDWYCTDCFKVVKEIEEINYWHWCFTVHEVDTSSFRKEPIKEIEKCDTSSQYVDTEARLIVNKLVDAVNLLNKKL